MVFIDYSQPKLKNSCNYNDTSGLRAVYNISWYIEGSVLGRHFRDMVDLWELDGDCYYPNGTKVVES